MTNMARLEATALALPEAQRVDIAEWGDHPTFRVRTKTFVFSNQEATDITVKLSPDEAAAVVASRGEASPAGYGLGRHGWVAVSLPPDLSAQQWTEIAEWVETSYRCVAPKRLVRVLDEPGQ